MIKGGYLENMRKLLVELNKKEEVVLNELSKIKLTRAHLRRAMMLWSDMNTINSLSKRTKDGR